MFKTFTKLVALCLFATSAAFAQEQHLPATPVHAPALQKMNAHAAKVNSVCIDTLNLPLSGTAALYRATAGGYVSGKNALNDKAKAEYFSNYVPFTHVTGAIIFFGRAAAANASSNVTVAVWNNTGVNGSPGTIIASKTVPISTIVSDIAANRATTVSFTSPVTIPGNFYVGVQWSNTPGDTVAIITNRNNDGPPNVAWEQLSNNNWGTYTSRWNLNVNHAIFPIVSTNSNGTGLQPTAAFTVSGTNVCAGTAVTFNGGTSVNASTYSWSFPGGTPSSSNVANPTVTYGAAGSYNATLTVTDGCKKTHTLTRTNVVTVKASPAVLVTPSAPLLCGPNPTPVTLTASGASSYTWSPAAGLNRTTGTSVTAAPAQTTIYKVVGTSNGCTDTATVVVVVNNIVASFTAPDTAYVNTPVQFTNTSVGGIGYQWTFGDGKTSTLKDPTNTFSIPGKYKVRLSITVANCNKVFDKYIVIVQRPVGIAEAFKRGEVKIYPNPAQDFLQVEADEAAGLTEVTLANAIGQVVMQEKANATSARLRTSELPNGIYFVTLSGAGGSVTRKISIAR
ncbi:MAG: PKD domain-containing protein [Hymenobacteraceae bacterium]|nr:PKD domain-containing protein [Hymenobacteraceae bacterium]